MSTARAYKLRLGVLLAAAVVGLVLAGPALADGTRDRGYADEVRQRLSVEGQRVEAQVRSALREAQSLLQRREPDKAVVRLQKALAMLEDDTALPENRRARLISMLKDRIRVAQAGPTAEAAISDKPLIEAKRKDDAERRAADAGKIQRALDAISELQKNGRNAEARRQARELARDFPDNPAARVANRNVDILDQLASADNFRRDQSSRLNRVYRDIDESALPIVGDMQIDYKRSLRARKRAEKMRLPLTAKERAILEALNRPITVHFQESRFQDVIDFLQTYADQPILPDKQALKDADVTYDTTVSLNVKGVSLRTVLRQVLGGFGLTYVVKDEIIQVVTAEQARKMMTWRVYPIDDLIKTSGLTDLRWGPRAGKFEMMKAVTQLIDTIQTSTEPDSWKANGGEGTISFNAATMSLAIKQTAEVHAMIGGGLR